MTKTILVVVIATALILGTSIQFVEAISWPIFQEIGLPMGQELFRVTDSRVLGPGEFEQFEVLCPGDDIFLRNGLSIQTNNDEGDFNFGSGPVNIPAGIQSGKSIEKGWFGQALNNEVGKDFFMEISIVCARVLPTVSIGGEWIQTDTTSLLLGYAMLNSYWIAPIAVGVGAGIYLTKNK